MIFVPSKKFPFFVEPFVECAQLGRLLIAVDGLLSAVGVIKIVEYKK